MSREQAAAATGAVVCDSGGRPCRLPIAVHTRGPARPAGVSRFRFPRPEEFAPGGQTLYLAGAALEPAVILEAYGKGYFPWPRSEEDELWWCSPNPRAILPVESFTVPRRLGRTIRSGRFRVSVDADFAGVIRRCAEREEGTWITPNLAAAYVELARLGWAHSFEVWLGEELAGGLYGLAVGGLFGAESMFSRVSDAGKVAVAAMVQHCRALGVELIDIQVLNPHTERLGGIEISRTEYLARLQRALARGVDWFGAARGGTRAG